MGVTFLRHTQPDVQKGICYGRTDLALAETFEADATRATADLPDFTEIIASPLTRCQRLAARIGPFETNPAFTEMDFGAWEMTPWDAIPRAELDLWADDFLHARPHGGESVAQLRDRVAKGLDTVPDGALIVTHHGVIKAAAALAGHPDGWDIALSFGTHITL